MNCIGRVAQHLALTTLELTTLGFIVCTIGTSFLWAQKPSDISLPVVLTVECTIAEILVAAGIVLANHITKPLWIRGLSSSP